MDRGGFEALLDVRNLLAEGYRPILLSDGSLLVFAQDQRSIAAVWPLPSRVLGSSLDQNNGCRCF
jgi:hypothetical protein